MDKSIDVFNPSLKKTCKIILTAERQIQILILTQNCSDNACNSGIGNYFLNKMLLVEGVHGTVGAATIF